MRILLLTRHGRLGSSSRQRFYQYVPLLAEQGFEIAATRLHDDSYLRRLYAGGGRRPAGIVGDYLRRIGFLITHRQWDLLWIEKEILPWLPAAVDRILAPSGVPWVVDYDDAVFYRYESHARGIARGLLGGKIDDVMRRSAIVVAGNRHLAERAERAGARRVELLPTVVDLRRYPWPTQAAESKDDVFTIGWIGSPTTASYLEGMGPALRAVCDEGGARFVCIGGKPPPLEGIPTTHHTWSEMSEAAEIARFDVGIMPLADAPWERGKCGYKLIQYMACGVPVVASPVGANSEIVEHGVQGFLAPTTEAWIDALKQLRRDPELRRRMGAAGRRRVEERYALHDAVPRLATFLRDAANAR